MTNVFTVDSLRAVCGIGSFLYYMAKKFKDKDITVIYTDNADTARLERISRYANVVKYDGGIIKCKRAIFGYDLTLVDKIEAEEYIQVIHANYKLFGLELQETGKPMRYIACSQHAAERFTEVTGVDCEVVYNPLDVDDAKPLVLMSATRMARGKGITRIPKLAAAFDAAGVNYIWFIFSDKPCEVDSKNVVFCDPRIDVVQLMPLADWFVQLSDDEAFGYSIVEANAKGVPTITTPIPHTDEFDIQGVCVDYDVEYVPIDDILQPERFKKALKGWQPPYSKWGELL